MLRLFIFSIIICVIFAPLKADESVNNLNSTTGGENIILPQNENPPFSTFFHEILSAVNKTIKDGSSISPKASDDDDDDSSDNFAKGIWGAFLFSLIGIAAFVVILILIIKFVCSPQRAKTKAPKPTAISSENLVERNSPPRNILAKNAHTEPQQFPPAAAATSFENQAMEFDNSNNSIYNNSVVSNPTSPSSYPVTQYQYPPPTFNNNPGYSREISNVSGSQPFSPVSQDNFAFSRGPYEPSPPEYKAVILPPIGAYESRSPPPATSPTPRFVPQSKSIESEYNPDYYDGKTPEEPFKYLDKYAPLSAQTPEINNQKGMSDLSSKRAVLHQMTPYKSIEERIQGEDYDDTDSFAPSPTQLAPSPIPTFPTPKPASLSNRPQLSSDSFNDGKSRLVRVLPRFHPSQQHNQQQMGQSHAGSSAVFQPVAPVPPPPPPQFQSQIYAVPRM